MTVSVLVMFAIIVGTGATIGLHPTDINSAADAAQALTPLAGPLAGVVFALGFIGTGLLGVPVLASAACIGISGLRPAPLLPSALPRAQERALADSPSMRSAVVASTAFRPVGSWARIEALTA